MTEFLWQLLQAAAVVVVVFGALIIMEDLLFKSADELEAELNAKADGASLDDRATKQAALRASIIHDDLVQKEVDRINKGL